MSLTISSRGIDLIKHFEGLRLTSYQCSAGVWTIGWGSTGPNVKPGMTITQAEAERLLRADIARFVAAVNRLVKVQLNQNQFDALVSFAFNCGASALARSTLLRRLNEGKFVEAANEFLRWNRAGGKVVAGLTRRREAERDLFNEPVQSTSLVPPPAHPPRRSLLDTIKGFFR